MHLIRQFLLNNRRLVASSLLLDFIANLIAIALPILLGQAFAALFGFQSARGRWLGWAGTASFVHFAGAAGGAIVARFMLDYFRKRLHGVLSEQFVYEIRRMIFLHHLHMDMREYENKGVGKYLLRFSGDMGSLQQLMSNGILQWISDLMLLTIGIILMIRLNPILGIWTTLSIAVLLSIGKLLEKKVEITEEERRNKKSGLLSFVSTRLLAIAPLKAFNRQTGELQQFDRRAERIRRLGIQYAGLKAAFDSLVAAGVYGIALSVLLAAWYVKQAGWGFQAEQTFALVLIVISWRTLLSRVLGVGLIWKRGGISLRKMTQLLQQPIEPEGIQITDAQKINHISFENVSFKRQGRVLLENISFKLKLGQTCCIIGASGSGKTLITKLLAGLYYPDNGQILIGAYPTTSLHPHLLRRQITFVSSAFPLYGKTLLDAIANSRKKENRQRARTTFQHWQTVFPILQDIDLNTRLSENKDRFSSAQLKLLECLRACLTRKKILVLDEPFQGLDWHTANSLAQLLCEDSSNKAILLLTSDELEVTHLPHIHWRLYLGKNEPAPENTTADLFTTIYNGCPPTEAMIAQVALRNLFPDW